ncbi:MAG TPA: ABC transporter substrate-binding protein [Gaiellaceae bacterium]|nr:ABC transporter substrate-binding protein [Gaiellaceae bacterium]
MRRKRLALGVAVALVARAAAVVGATSASGAKGTIIIGYAADFSGGMAPFDNPALTAARLEAKKINGQGGVLGKKLEIISCDTQNSKPDVSKSCVDNLVSKGAVIGMVTCDVDFATAAIQEFLAKKMLTIAPCIGTDQMGPKRFGAAGKLAFSYGNVAQDEGAAMAEYAYNVKHWKTAITVTNNLLVYFKEIIQAFTSRYTQLGGKIVDSESYTTGQNQVQGAVSRVNAHKAAMIAVCDGFPPDWPAFVAGIRSLNNNTPIMNSWAGDGTFWYPKTPKVSNYWYVTYASAFGDDPSAAVRKLIGQMTAIHQAPATGGFVTGAAAVDGVVTAIKQAKGSTNGAVLAALMQKFHNLPTISGKVSFSANLHSVFGRAYRVMQVQNSTPKFVQLYTAKKLGKISG